jgi:hypothetical protein
VGIDSTNRFPLNSSNQIFQTSIEFIALGEYMYHKPNKHTLTPDGNRNYSNVPEIFLNLWENTDLGIYENEDVLMGYELIIREKNRYKKMEKFS